MNIVYKLTNLSKSEGKRFYIGSKKECYISKNTDGVPTIYSIKSRRPYYGSSSSQEMRSDLKAGDVFHAEVLEIVPTISELYSKEEMYLSIYNVAESDDYYNLSSKAFKVGCHENQDSIINLFGETMKELANRRSCISRRDDKAQKAGYKNFGEMTLCWINDKLNNMCLADIAARDGFSVKTVRCCLKSISVDDFDRNNTTENILKIRKYILEGATIQKISELMGIPIPVVRYLLDTFKASSLVASSLKMTVEEAERFIAHEVINNNKKFSEIEGFSKSSASRYFVSYVRKRLKGSDL